MVYLLVVWSTILVLMEELQAKTAVNFLANKQN